MYIPLLLRDSARRPNLKVSCAVARTLSCASLYQPFAVSAAKTPGIASRAIAIPPFA
ncbi:MAG: hypothetical protein LBO82_04830 [Synergistaceae bacterium]|nr:hypothetical protein [Synergistaceae bacterium]